MILLRRSRAIFETLYKKPSYENLSISVGWFAQNRSFEILQYEISVFLYRCQKRCMIIEIEKNATVDFLTIDSMT